MRIIFALLIAAMPAVANATDTCTAVNDAFDDSSAYAARILEDQEEIGSVGVFIRLEDKQGRMDEYAKELHSNSLSTVSAIGKLLDRLLELRDDLGC
ncbi:MAG: hypothetical protein AAF678_08855 [Pseudomonadota bacterium]